MITATPTTEQAAFDDAFRLDPTTEDLSQVRVGLADTTNNGCGPSPTTGPTTGCASPDGPVLPVRGCHAV